MTTRKNASVKALQSHLATVKKWDKQALLEWQMACNTNAKRGPVWNQYDIMDSYDRNGDNADGCSKAVHLYDHKGNKFKDIVIKRHQQYGWLPDARNEHSKCTGNQLIDEINCWLEFQELPESDYLCPILKYFTSKSDKVDATSETMLNNVIIIAQRAVYVRNLKRCCEYAEEMNADGGYKGTNALDRYEEMKAFAYKQGWRDAVGNSGNSGVIFDYNQNCYKAVFIDYAL